MSQLDSKATYQKRLFAPVWSRPPAEKGLGATEIFASIRGNRSWPACTQPGMDETEREAIRAEGFDPDDPGVVTAIDFVR